MLYVSQSMEVYTLIIYFIYEKRVNITLNYHLQLKVQCNFIYATKGFFCYKVDCNCFLITNHNRKLAFFY
jgi:hypothetical protein